MNQLRKSISQKLHLQLTRFAHSKPKPSPPIPSPPKPPQNPRPFTFNDITWEDPYAWMSTLSDKVSMRHMDVSMEQEEKYTEAVMADTVKIQTKLQSEMASRMASCVSTPPVKWGPWLYYRRVEEGKQYPVLCRRLASLNEEFISYNSPSAGFDYTSGKRIEQKLLDYNKEAERFGGYAYEELSEISPDHRYLAYTLYDKDNDFFRLSVKDLNSGSLCSKPEADRVSNLAWAKDGQALLYTVTDDNRRPYRIFCCMLGSKQEDVMLLEDLDENVFVNIRQTKDFRFVTVNTFSPTFSKVYLINSADPLAGMTLVWEGEPQVHCIVEHHQGCLYLFTDAAKDGQFVDNHYLLQSPVEVCGSRTWEEVFLDESDFIIEDVDFNDTHLVLILREGRTFNICSVPLPLPNKGPIPLKQLNPTYLPLPTHVSQIASGPNYDYYSSVMRFTISSPVMPDAMVDYDLKSGKWFIVQQQNVLHERSRTLYGPSSSASATTEKTQTPKQFYSKVEVDCEDQRLWNDLSDFYACEHYDVPSHDMVQVPLTIIYSRRNSQNVGQSPCLLHGHGAYGELLDKRWRSELKSLLDRGWVIAYADVRGGGGRGKKWHHDGRRIKKENSIKDYISCAKYLINNELVHPNKLAGWGYSAGGLLVASAINMEPDLFRAAILKVPFLDPLNTLIYPILPLTPIDYEEFGYPCDLDDFEAIRKYSPYDNVQKDVVYPSVLVTSSFTTRFGVWEAAKWVARVRERTVYDPKRPILLNLTTTDLVEENRYLQCKESALESAFLLKAMDS
ncbi:hypothetical protein ACHQM5_023378 [Ranunculus cassubicifolius]